MVEGAEEVWRTLLPAELVNSISTQSTGAQGLTIWTVNAPAVAPPRLPDYHVNAGASAASCPSGNHNIATASARHNEAVADAPLPAVEGDSECLGGEVLFNESIANFA